MTENSSRLWSVPAFLEYVQPPLNDISVAAAERQLNVKLPAAYIALLRGQNGGYTEATLPDSPQSQIWGIGPKFPSILEGSLKHRNAQYAGEVWLPRQPDALIPFDGDGHWFLCFDFRTSGRRAEPSITIVYLEGETEAQVAQGFDAFLNLLERDFGDHAVLGIGGVDEEAAVSVLERDLRIQFNEPNNFDHGYPIRTAKFREGNPPEWIWVDPNAVPLGFSRESGKVHVTSETGYRFPDRQDLLTIVTCSKESLTSIVAAFERAGLTPVSMRAP